MKLDDDLPLGLAFGLLKGYHARWEKEPTKEKTLEMYEMISRYKKAEMSANRLSIITRIYSNGAKKLIKDFYEFKTW
jgi:hypothetical protein